MRFHKLMKGATTAFMAGLFTWPVLSGAQILEEDFEGSFPPSGWKTADESAAGLDCAWRRSDEYTLTGLVSNTLGAAADSDHCAPEETPEGDVDTSLISPELDLSGSSATVMSYDIAYRHFFPSSEATLDISTDGGVSWTTLVTYNSSPPISEFPPQQEVVDLSDYDGETGVTLRWRYMAGHGWWVFVDNVVVGPAGPGVLEVEPQTLDLGDVHTGVVATDEVIVSNAADPGHGDIELDAVDLTGDGGFTILGGDCEAGTVLQPGGSCLVKLAFVPDAVDEFSGQLQVGAAGGQIESVTLSGTGIPTSQIGVDPEALSATLEIGQAVDQTLEIANSGTADLDWTIPLVHDQGLPAGTGFGDLLREGALLVHNSGSSSIVALDPETGDVIDPNLVATDSLGFGAKRRVLLHPDGERLLLSHQTDNVVHAFDFEGQYLGVFAPAGGADTTVMQNIRGMAFHPDTGNLLVTSGSGVNAHSVVEFDREGNYLGEFIASGSGGLDGPWSLEFRDSDLLVGAGLSGELHAFEHDGTPIGAFTATAMNFIQQVHEIDNGNILVADSAGILEFDASGSHIGTYSQFNSVSGVYELPGGDLIVTASSGIHQIDRQGNVVRDILGGASSMISAVKAVDCTLPDWLSVDPASGTVPVSGAAAQVTVTFDASGLGQGSHEAVICVESNDPLEPRIQVPVSLMVEQPEDYGVVEGAVESAGHCGVNSSVLEGVAVVAAGSGGVTVSTTTDEEGAYSLSVPESASPVDIVVSAAEHLEATATDVSIEAGQNVTENFELVLDAPCATVTEISYHFELDSGDDATDTLVIGNANGGGSLDWSVNEGPGLNASIDPRAHFPQRRRFVQHKHAPDTSAFSAPQSAGGRANQSADSFDGFTVPAFSTTGNQDGPGYVALDALVPSALTTINPDQPTTFYAGAFIRNDLKNHYMLAAAGGSEPLNAFGRVSTTTGVFTLEGQVTGAPAVSIWTSMSWDHTTGTLYAMGNEDELYAIDPDSLEAKLVGTISGPDLNPDGPVVVAIAVSPDGLMYALELRDDVLLAVDKTTADAEVLGSVGVDANFAQDMDFDQTTGTLYWAAYLDSNDGEMYTLDLKTGESELIGEIQGRSELQSFTVATPGGGCATPEDIGWLSVDTAAGTVAPQGSEEVSFSINSDGLQHGHYEAFLCVATNDSVKDEVWIPISLDVTDPEAGFLQGNVTSAGRCGQNSYALAGATVTVAGASHTYEVNTDETGAYSVAINEGQGPIHISVEADNHLEAEVADVVIEAGMTTTVDVELPIDAPCFTVEPEAIEVEVGPSGTASRTLTLGNLDGHALLEWSLDMAGPFAMPPTTLQQMTDNASGGHWLSRAGGMTTGGVGASIPLGDMQMSQTFDTNIVPGNSAGCVVGPNHSLRRFYFDEHPGVGKRINSVDIGIQETMGTPVVTVNLYRLPSSTPVDTIPVESLELVGAAVRLISTSDDLNIVNVPVEGVIDDIEAYDLVVEVVASGAFYIGATDTGETHPGFVVAPWCGIEEPTRLDQLEGFENTHIIHVVNVSDGGSCAPPDEIPWLSVSPEAGNTAAGESSEVTVSFNAVGLAAGEHHAVVCANGNDPGRRRIEVPVHLVVDDPSGSPIFADRFEAKDEG